MAEYIEREGLLENLEERLSDLRFIVKYEKRHGSVSDEEKAKAKLEKLNEVINLIKSQPTADVPEVRHASWVKNQEDMYWGNPFIRRNCSICGGSPIYREGLGTYKLTPYCPHCGAKMSEKVGE